MMNIDQRVDEGRLEADHVRLEYRDFTNDKKVTLLPHRRGMDKPDPPGSDICDRPNTSDTQRDEWLLKTEPLQGARPKWNVGERPPVVDDWMGVLDLEATGGVGGRNVEQHGNPAPLLPLERQTLQEEEVTTPPRGGGAHGPGGRPAPEPQVPPGCNRTWRTFERRTGCSSGSAYPSTGGVHNDESTTVWWDDQLGTVPTGF